MASVSVRAFCEPCCDSAAMAALTCEIFMTSSRTLTMEVRISAFISLNFWPKVVDKSETGISMQSSPSETS